VTEHEWLYQDWSSAMLAHLIHKASDRKFRLFAVACCRRIWDHFRDSRAREAVEVAERFADGAADNQELRAARQAMTLAQRELPWRQRGKPRGIALRAAQWVVADQSWDAARGASWDGAWAATPTGMNVPGERQAQAELVREVFGNPFTRPATGPVEAAWLPAASFQEAEAIYAGKAFDRLPALAAALEQACCPDAGLLAHLRKPGPHCRGCWALDLLTRRW
jgi:hypothetical protein